MLDKSFPQKDYVISEYMGPGCPDMLNRRMWLSIRDDKFIVGYKVGLYESFEDGELTAVFDLNVDPNGYYNVSKKIDRNRIQYLLELLEARYVEIKADTKDFMDSFISV